MIRRILRVVWPLCGRIHPSTGKAIRDSVAHLKRGGTVAGAAGLASRDPMAAELFLRAVRESGWA